MMLKTDDEYCIKEYVTRATSSEDNKKGWAIFDEEMAWFLYDFFKLKLNGYEKLLFYSFYINGFTNEELAKILGISTQATSVKILNLNKKLKKTWENRKSWREK